MHNLISDLRYNDEYNIFAIYSRNYLLPVKTTVYFPIQEESGNIRTSSRPRQSNFLLLAKFARPPRFCLKKKRRCSRNCKTNIESTLGSPVQCFSRVSFHRDFSVSLFFSIREINR